MNNSVTVNLFFDHKPSGLLGGDIGESVYQSQIADKIRNVTLGADTKLILVFPNYVERVAASFTQGLTKELAKKYSRPLLATYIFVEASSERLAEKIIKDINF